MLCSAYLAAFKKLDSVDVGSVFMWPTGRLLFKLKFAIAIIYCSPWSGPPGQEYQVCPRVERKDTHTRYRGFMPTGIRRKDTLAVKSNYYRNSYIRAGCDTSIALAGKNVLVFI